MLPPLLQALRPPRLLFAQVREDPAVDQAALALQSTDRVLTITSGGCTALALLADGPASLTAIDCNPAQTHLLELKAAAIAALPLEACRGFLGARPSRTRRRTFDALVAGRLSAEARAFWRRRRGLIDRGALNAGATEALTGRWMPALVFGGLHRPALWRALASQPTLAAQAACYRARWDTSRWRGRLRLAFHPALFRLIYGRAFFERAGRPSARAFAEAWRAKIDHAFTELPARSNYFLTQCFWGRYPSGEQGLPPYLRRGVFERVRAHLDRLRWRTADLRRALREAAPGAWTKLALSNALEWLPAAHAEAAWFDIARLLPPGGRVVSRHLLAATPVPAGLPLRALTAVSDALTRQERAFLYARVAVHERP